MRATLLFLVFSAFLACAPHPELGAAEAQKKHIAVNNRVLAKVNGKAISVMDVMKKLDMLFYRQYPEYLNSLSARFQFYRANWRAVLSDLIDRELVIAEAEEKHFPISSGDVRQELEEIFGPNVMVNLHDAGLTMEDAWEMVKADILIRRMLHMQVRMRILPKISPKEIRKAYETYQSDTKNASEWAWQAVTIQTETPDVAMPLAEEIHRLVMEEHLPLDALEQRLEAEGSQVSISPVHRQRHQELAATIVEVLTSLRIGECSRPLVQKTRSGSPVIRLYLLHGKTDVEVRSLPEMEQELREQLSEAMIAAETEVYFTRLRQHFDVREEDIEEQLPDHFQPFELK